MHALLVAGMLVTAVQADDAGGLRRLTERRFLAAAASDRAFYEGLLAPNFLLLDPGAAPRTKSEYLETEFAPGHVPSGAAEIEDFRALMDGDTAVASYTVAESHRIGDQVLVVRSQRVDTYARVAGRWRLQSMAIAEPPWWPAVAAVNLELFDEYAGTYRMPPDTLIIVSNEGGHLMAQVAGGEKSELLPEDETTFFDRTDSPQGRTVFERDATGKVVAQVYRLHGQALRAEKIK